MRKAYIVDTSALINDPETIFKFGDNDVIVPITVLEELDRKKKDFNGAGPGAREASRQIFACQQYGSLREGARLPTGGTIRISYEAANWNELPIGLEKTNDNRILLIAKKWKKKDHKVVIVSQDTNLLLKAMACDLGTENCVGKRSSNGLGIGIMAIEVPNADLYAEFTKQSALRFNQISGMDQSKLFENQCCSLHFGGQSCLALCKKSQNFFQFVPRPRTSSRKGIQPLNDEQVLALALMLDPEIGIVALSGKPGSGKTLLALLAGYGQMQLGKYEQMIIYRSTHDVDKSMGYLPGDADDKYQPWCQPIVDNFELILESEPPQADTTTHKRERVIHSTEHRSRLAELLKTGKLLMTAITFVRGRSLHRKFAIGDESQNWTRHVVKTLLTRKGFGTKMVITGDPEQIDNPYLDRNSNGLSIAIDSLRGQKTFGHIIMTKSERSDDAQMVATLM
jgi:PhoH-like ATPase